jgi:hypothetical protein
MEEDWVSSSDPEQAASDFGASGKNWQGDSDEDAIMTFSSKSMLADGSEHYIHHKF